MILLTSQILIFMIITILGIFIFRKYEFTLTSRHLTICAQMITVSTVLQLLSMTIPLLGFPSLRVGFSQLPIMMLGILLNPAYAFFAGILKDIVGLIVAPSGPPYLGFTLNTILVGVIPALCYHLLYKKETKSLKQLVYTVIVILIALSATFIIRPDWIGISDVTIAWEIKSVLLLVLLLIGVVLIRITMKNNDNLFLVYALAVFLVEVIVNFTSTPIYLNLMYGLPIGMSVMVRMFKAAFMFPITVMVGYFVLKAVMHSRFSSKK